MQFLTAAYLAFVSLVFLCLFAIDVKGIAKSKEERWRTSRSYRPRTLVIVPCKGDEIGLRRNLEAAERQSYDNYSVVAVVDKDDHAMKAVRLAKVKHIRPGSRWERCSDKVRRVASAIDRFRNYDAYVILDSDELVGRDWLGRLVAPLADRRVGISVMFPVFEPLDSGFWSVVKLVWGFVGQSLLESRSTRFAAGGSMAFRKGLLDRASFRFFTGSRYSVSDDISLNLIAKKKRLAVAYDRHHHPKTYVKESYSSLVEWANRQTALSIFGYRRILYYGVAYYSAEILVFATGIVGAIAISPLFLILLLHAASSSVRNLSRTRTADAMVILITLFMPFFYLANLIVASRMRSIKWRGTSYRLR